MQILSGIAETRAALRELRASSSGRPRSVGFVPTMGALHDGHRSLLRAARQQCEVAVASIFVNPLQFAPHEDLSRYPRTIEDDCRMLELEAVDLVFRPTVDAMVPSGSITFVEVAEIGDRLDGASRPGHFRGVATIVAKLFHIVQPDIAYFGQKDAAQVAVLRKMVKDLNFPVELNVCPIVRESDGLAMSSRNRYLSVQERQHALSLYRALQTAETLVTQGEHSASALTDAMTASLRRDPAVRIDYISIVDPDTLLPLEDIRSGALLAVAAYVGNTRLIDNILLAPSR